MTIKYKTESFFESSGNVAATFGETLRDSIASHACDIWEQFPSWVTEGKNPASSFSRGYMNSMCSADGRTPPVISLPDFTGGQCIAIQYDVTVEYNLGAGLPLRDRTSRVFGSVRGAEARPSPNGNIEIGVVAGDGTLDNNERYSVIDAANPQFGGPDFVRISSVVRVDGQPDDCGDPPPSYGPETPPTQDDLNTIININNNDGVTNNYELTYNQVFEGSNFPFNFKLNGINVTLDLEGITIYSDPNITSNNNNPELPPPGSDGGRDVDGNDYTTTYPEQDLPTAPEFTTPNLVNNIIEYAVCELGVIGLVEETVKLPPGFDLIWTAVFAVLKNVVEELCAVESDVGLPEIFPVLPGVDRPIIMYYFKTFVDGTKGSSTYVATLPNPTTSAVNEIENVAVPDRVLGQYVCSLKLLDGSRIVARGETESEASAFFSFLFSRTDPSNIPPDSANKKIVTENKRLDPMVEVKCTQIEYYPDGKSFGRTASVKRVVALE